MIALLPLLLAALGAAGPLATPSAVPSPSASPAPLKEIGEVHAMGPYCASFYQHFNAIVAPMVRNDATLDQASIVLDDLNGVFKKIDKVSAFYALRLKLMKDVRMLTDANTLLQPEINQLRRGEKLTADPQRAHEMHMLAQELQRAYDKQHQLQTDLLGVVQAMMEFDMSEHPGSQDAVARARETLDELHVPAAARNVKVILRWNGMRDRLRDAEGMAAAHAQTILAQYC